MSTQKKQETLFPAYLIVGADALKRAAVMTRLRSRLAAVGDLSFNSDEFNGETARGADIVMACNTIPFASPLRLVVVHSAEKLKKTDTEAIVAYLAAPNLSTVLAIEAESLAKNTRLYKVIAAFDGEAIIDCTPPKVVELPKMVRSMAVGYGVTFTQGAAAKLVELVGENTVHLDAEVKKIALAHRGTDAVNEHEVASLTARTAEVKSWDFVDAFSARDIQKCLLYLGHIETKSKSPQALIGKCVTRLRELVCARSLLERGQLGAVASALKMSDWLAEKRVRWARGFSSAELRRAIVSARDAERAMKSGSNPDDVFLDWILAVVAVRKENSNETQA